MTKKHRLPILNLIAVLLVAAWSVIQPTDIFIWLLEASPVAIALAILIPTYRTFRFTDLVYTLIGFHCVILLLGAHYTYAEVPGFVFGDRNYYDRLGHLVQGFVPAMVARELLLKTSPLKPGKWLFAIIVLSVTGISAIYELIEMAVSLSTGEGADAFLGTQGDIWDTQKDMLMAAIGATTALLTLAGIHDRQLRRKAK